MVTHKRLSRLLITFVIAVFVCFQNSVTAFAASSYASGNGTVTVSDYGLDYAWETTYDKADSSQSGDNNGGSGSATLSGSVFTMSAKSSYYKAQSWSNWTQDIVYNYTTRLTITNNGEYGCSVSYTTTGSLGSVTDVFMLGIGESKVFTLATNNSPTSTKAQNLSGTLTIDSISVMNSIQANFVASEYGEYSYAIGEDVVVLTAGAQSISVDLQANASVTLAASDTLDGYSFYAWMSNEELVSKTTPYTYTASIDATIYPVFLPDTLIAAGEPFLVGTTLHMFWNTAVIDALNTGNTIVLARDYTLPEDLNKNGLVLYKSSASYVTQTSDGMNYTIPSGVTLLIPYDLKNTLVTSGDAVLDAYDTSIVARSEYRALTMASGTEITVENGGAISVSSGRANQFIGQIGPYGAIYMNEGSEIVVKSGGTMFAWGYIFHGDDNGGTVTIENGGTVYEPISIMDYPGSASLAQTLTDAKVFPMRSYSVRNVEVSMELENGAKEYVFTCLYGDNPLVGTNPLTILFIANGTVNNETPVFRASGSVTKSYENSRMHMVFNGDFTLNSMSVTLAKTLGTYTINSSETSGFYIPSCYDMVLESGTVTLNGDVIMCEGGTFTISKGTTVNTNGKNIYILDADNDPGAVERTNGCSIDVQDVHGKYYTNAPKDAILDINGTVIANGGFYTSTAGAAIISSEGGGVIQVTGTSTSTSVNVKNTNSYTAVNIGAAKLKNGNGTYVQSEAGTYTYIDGFWYKPGDHEHVWGENATCECGMVAAAKITANGTTTYYGALQAAITACPGSNYVQMHTDTEAVASANDDYDVCVDLAGKTVNLTILSGTNKVYFMDKSTDGYSDSNGRVIASSTVANSIPDVTSYAIGSETKRNYVKVVDTKGDYAFPRVATTLSGIGYRSNAAGSYLTYQNTLRGNTLVKDSLSDMGFLFGSASQWRGSVPDKTDQDSSTAGWTIFAHYDVAKPDTLPTSVLAQVELDDDTNKVVISSYPTADQLAAAFTALGLK